MLKPLAQYVRDEAAPRCRAIILSWEALISLFVVAFFFKFGASFFAIYPKVSDLTTGLIAYSSIALGFCVAGLTISLTLPEPKFTLRLATSKRDGQKTNAYSDLLFVFSWTAIAHWFAILALFAVVLFSDGAISLLPSGHSYLRTLVVSILAGLCAYCLCLFLITLITLSQVGNVYIKFLSEPKPKDH